MGEDEKHLFIASPSAEWKCAVIINNVTKYCFLNAYTDSQNVNVGISLFCFVFVKN